MGSKYFAPITSMECRGLRATGGCSACVEEQTRAWGGKSQAEQTRRASKERGDAGQQEWASHARQVRELEERTPC
jgi:hypothetical protein